MGSIRKNLVYNSAYQILIIILPLITSPYISRVIGPTGIGIYAYTSSISSYFVLLGMLGVNAYGSRSIAFARHVREEIDEKFWSIYWFQLFCSICSLLFYIIFIFLYVDENIIFFHLQIIFVISSVFDINWFCFGLEEFKISVVRNVIIKLITVVAIFSLVDSESDLWIYTLIMAASIFFSQLTLWIFFVRRIKFILPSITNIRNNIKPIVVLFLPMIAVSIYKLMDRIMLGYMSSFSEVGYFTNAEQIINVPMGIITALGTVMLPRMSNMVASGQLNKSKEIIEKSMTYTMIISFAFAFGIAGMAPVFTIAFFGEAFSKSIDLIIYLTSTIVFIGWGNVIRTQYLLPNAKDNILVLSVGLAAVVNLLFNLFLIPIWGALGAVIGTVLAELTVCLVQTFIVKNIINIHKQMFNNLVFMFFGIIMFIVIRFCAFFFTNTLFIILTQITLGSLIYIVLLLIYFLKIRHDTTFLDDCFSLIRVNKKQ